jgi:hypothetical protein
MATLASPLTRYRTITGSSVQLPPVKTSPKLSPLTESSALKRAGMHKYEGIDTLPANIQATIAYYKDKAEKAEKVAIDAQRDLYHALVRESKLHMQIITLQGKIDTMELAIKLFSDKKKDTKQ